MDLSPRTPKGLMALAFCSMSIPCLTHPDKILQLALQKNKIPETPRGKETAKLLMRCFGSQALLSGIAISIGEWNPTAYAIWTGAIIPFFAFDYLAWKKGFLTPFGAIGDAVGNVIFVSCSIIAGGFLKRERKK